MGGSSNHVITIVDTNVFLSTGDEIFRKYRSRDFVIPLVVFKELEKFRTYDGGLGRMARTVIRRLEELRSENPGVNMAEHGVDYPGTSNTVRIEMDNTDQSCLTSEIQDSKYADRTIMAVAKNLKSIEDEQSVVEDRAGRHVVLVTNDACMRFLANLEGIHAVEYTDDNHRDYTGVIDVDLDELDFDGDISELDDEDLLELVREVVNEDSPDMDAPLPAHALIRVTQADGTVDVDGRAGIITDWFMKDGDTFREMTSEVYCPAGPVHPRNLEQAVASEYLNNDRIQMVSLGGVAGAGKSLLSLAYGLDQVQKGNFSKVTVFRLTYALGRQEQGFLPGDLDSKMAPWAQAVWDNVQKYDRLKTKNRGKRRSGNADDSGIADDPNERLKAKYGDIISVEPITYLRGRTLEDQLIIVDDAQSLDRSDLLDVISRLGETSKIVFTFDLDQQDNPYLEKDTSIAWLVNRLRNDPTFAHISFTKSERSRLAQLASKLLNELK